MPYKELKLITPAAVYNARNMLCVEFNQEFQTFLEWWQIPYGVPLQFFKPISLAQISPQFEKHPLWEKFLIENGFIKREKEKKFYHIGQKFYLAGFGKYVLASVRKGIYNQVSLIKYEGEHTGTYWKLGVDVENQDYITEEEFGRITKGQFHSAKDFVEIEEYIVMASKGTDPKAIKVTQAEYWLDRGGNL